MNNGLDRGEYDESLIVASLGAIHPVPPSISTTLILSLFST